MPEITITPQLDCAVPTPIVIEIPAGAKLPDGDLILQGGGHALSAQREGNRLVTIIPSLAAGKSLRLQLARGEQARGVTLKEADDALTITLPEGMLTEYRYGAGWARPFFYPVHGPGGLIMTRHYPMKPDVPGEAHDHPHHKSLWTAYGEVNGVDDWSEEKNHGFIRHQKFESRWQGSVFGGFSAQAVWTSPEGTPLLDERRTFRAYNVGPNYRLLDYDVALVASYEDLHYGDTKEAGILAIRVATSMDGNKGGRMENSNGGATEKECWGKRANWLDYSGPVEGQTVGFGMMDHPGNFHHPCYWHARDYGLVGTNPFAKAAFEGGEKTGSHQKKGETLTFRYRVLLHRGAAKEGRVDEAYHAWVQPPRVQVSG
jgi:hypothetical protein